jgi:SAM-dependent methyltransferase
VVPGFRDWVLAAPRASVQPKPEWTDADYEVAAAKKIHRFEQLVAKLRGWDRDLAACSVLDVGCGAGIDTLLLAMHPARSVLGIDLDFPLTAQDERGERTRRLAREVLDQLGVRESPEELIESTGLRFARMTAADMELADGSFDLVISRAVLEHVSPIDAALGELGRVTAPDGLLWHSIDPFYWMKGCHKGGLVDLPWAHARLTPGEYRRYVAEREGERHAERRCRHLETLNQLGLDAWRAKIEGLGYDVLEWTEDRSKLAEAVLDAHPEALDRLQPGVDARDLTRSSIKTWLRAPTAG